MSFIGWEGLFYVGGILPLLLTALPTGIPAMTIVKRHFRFGALVVEFGG